MGWPERLTLDANSAVSSSARAQRGRPLPLAPSVRSRAEVIRRFNAQTRRVNPNLGGGRLGLPPLQGFRTWHSAVPASMAAARLERNDYARALLQDRHPEQTGKRVPQMPARAGRGHHCRERLEHRPDDEVIDRRDGT